METTEYTNKELSRLLDLTPGRVTQLAAQGKITRLPNGKYPTAAIQEYLAFLRDRAPVSSPINEQLLQEKYRALKRENDIEEGLVAPVELLTDALQKAGAIVVANLESLPLLMKRHWPEITGDQVMMVKKAVAECRNTIADMKIDMNG